MGAVGVWWGLGFRGYRRWSCLAATVSGWPISATTASAFHLGRRWDPWLNKHCVCQGTGSASLGDKRCPRARRLADRVRGGEKKNQHHPFLREREAGEPVYPVCLFICFLLTYCNTSSMGLGRPQDPQGLRWVCRAWPAVAHRLPLQSSPTPCAALLHNQTGMLIIPRAWKV